MKDCYAFSETLGCRVENFGGKCECKMSAPKTDAEMRTNWDEFHACFTGDCPHDNVNDCIVELRKAAAEAARATPSERERELVEAGNEMRDQWLEYGEMISFISRGLHKAMNRWDAAVKRYDEEEVGSGD